MHQVLGVDVAFNAIRRKWPFIEIAGLKLAIFTLR